MVENDVLTGDLISKFLPRNLSYTEESYLDNFSQCGSFVNSKEPPGGHVIGYFRTRLELEAAIRRRMADIDLTDRLRKLELEDENDGEDEGTSVDPVVNTDKSKKNDGESEVSEEGIFVNMMDDLDSIPDSNQSRDSTGSDPSYFSLDSITSPEENLEQSQCEQRCFTEALNKELAKTECLRKTASEGSIMSPDDSIKSDELKKATSVDTVFAPKSAQLKMEIQGELFASADVHRYLLHVPDSPVYDEPEFNINRAELRKSSSLKTNKTPPGTPSRKKMVRFADALGLDLESVRHVIDADNPPKIPASAISDLKVGVEKDRAEVGSRYLDLCFPQPCADTNFIGRVMANKVLLENCVITDMSITGVVRVANIGYHKCVRVRYSINNWVTFYDVMASYIQNSCDGATDRFAFTIVAPANVGPGSKISFAVSYTVNDQVYWDSNDRKNYEILCYAKTTPTDLEASWVHFV